MAKTDALYEDYLYDMRHGVRFGTASLLTLDPGLTGTGYVLWARTEAKIIRPVAAGVIRAAGESAWWDRALLVGQKVETLIHSRIPRTSYVIAEFTEYHAAAHRVMAWKTGDLQRLTFLCGVIGHVCRHRYYLPVPTSHWKGQMSKSIVELRVYDRLGSAVSELGIQTHAFDAAGIGLWAFGKL